MSPSNSIDNLAGITFPGFDLAPHTPKPAVVFESKQDLLLAGRVVGEVASRDYGNGVTIWTAQLPLGGSSTMPAIGAGHSPQEAVAVAIRKAITLHAQCLEAARDLARFLGVAE